MTEVFYQAFEAEPPLIRGAVKAAAEALKTLLETKHLYQRVAVDIDRVIRDVGARVIGDDGQRYAALARKFKETTRLIPSTKGLSRIRSISGGSAREDIPTLVLRNVKLFCDRCDARETFAPVFWMDVVDELRKPRDGAPEFDGRIPPVFQLFHLSYQCQTCKTVPVSFIVRRAGWDFFVDGRSPMEVVEVAKFLPKAEVKYFRDAQIAFGANKTLAALFYLRTFIELFARRIVGAKERMRGDELMAAYAQTLPAKYRDEMPSLAYWYEKLSEPIHAGEDNEERFVEASAEIERHFDFRRLYRIEDKPAEKKQTE